MHSDISTRRCHRTKTAVRYLTVKHLSVAQVRSIREF